MYKYCHFRFDYEKKLIFKNNQYSRGFHAVAYMLFHHFYCSKSYFKYKSLVQILFSISTLFADLRSSEEY